MTVRWISGSRQSMQRLGFCKVLVLDEKRVRSGNDLIRVLQNYVTSEFWVTPDDHIFECLNTIPNVDIDRNESENRIKVALQHYYICRHPSKSGWLSRKAVKEYVEGLPRYLGLLDNTYRQTDFGQVLGKGLISEQEKKAFDSVSTDINPLILTLPQKVFFLYSLLLNDGDFLIPFVQSLASNFGMQTFSYLHAGETVPKVLQMLIDRFTGTGYTKKDRAQLRQLRSALDGVERAITDQLEKQGSGSRREQITIPRMEWLIDLSLAEKVGSKQGSRLYKLTDSGHSFACVLSTEYDRLLKVKYVDEAMDSLLDDKFFQLASVLSQREAQYDPQHVDIVDYLRPAYDELSGVSGYFAVRPLLLLANSRRLDEEKSVVSYKYMMQALEKAYRSNPDRVYYTVTRSGSDYQVKLDI